MYHIEVLVEDSSGGKIMEGLLTSILKKRTTDWSFEIRRHRGIGKLPDNWDAKPAKLASGLLHLLPAKLRVYSDAYKKSDKNIIIVALDTDHKNPDLLYRELKILRSQYASALVVVLAIAVEELEAWLLGDRAALLKAYPEADVSILDQYIQDAVVGTWEVLARAVLKDRASRLIKAGYPAVGTYKHRFAVAIAKYLEAERNQSPSFRSFHRYFLKCLDDIEKDEI